MTENDIKRYGHEGIEKLNPLIHNTGIMKYSLNLTEQNEMLEQARWFAEHGMIDTAIAIIDAAFGCFLKFRAWWLTESMEDCRLFPQKFSNWVAKIWVLMYANYNNPDDSDTRTFADLTMIELRKMKATKA